MATLPSRWHCMQTSSRRAGASLDGLTISPLPAAMWAGLSPWQRSQVMPSCAKSGMSYLFSVPAMGARDALVWQLRQPGYAGRFIGMNFASWKAGVVLGGDAVVDTRGGVGEVGGGELVDRLAAGAGHGGLGIRGGDSGVA